MHIVSVDSGHYSVKLLSGYLEKKNCIYYDSAEVIVREWMEEHTEISDEAEARKRITKELIETYAKPDTKIILQAPTEMTTLRFLTLPVKSRKKAEQMLPFQLEEGIPYSLHESHYAYRLDVQKSQTLAMTGIVKLVEFEPYVEFLKTIHPAPAILASESSVVESYFNQYPMAGPFCVLDIGHEFTKAYFFYNSKLISTHFSYFGGKNINQMIAQTYKISLDEAIFYKHQNAFVLSESQWGEVDDKQKEFAKMMDQTLSPMINDFIRWELGFRVHYGLKCAQIYLMGGTSNIRNISTYLTDKFSTKVNLFETFEGTTHDKIELNHKNKARLANANMQVLSLRLKSRLINFLSGRFSLALNSEIPIHSLAFLGARVTTVTFFVLIGIFSNRFFIESDIKEVNAKITSLSKNPILNLSGRERRTLTTNPKMLSDSLLRKSRSIKQQLSTIQSSVEIKALEPLVQINSIAGGSEAMLTKFEKNEDGDILASFTALNIETLKQLEAKFNSSQLKDVQTVINDEKLTLEIKAVE
jgi:general secretion pathway protein L